MSWLILRETNWQSPKMGSILKGFFLRLRPSICLVVNIAYFFISIYQFHSDVDIFDFLW